MKSLLLVLVSVVLCFPSLAVAGEDDVLAKVNGEEIKDKEVHTRIKPRIRKLESQIFDVKRSELNSVIEEKLLQTEAKKRGISTDELIKAEVRSKVADPSQAEIENAYELLKSRFKGQPLSKVKAQVVAQLRAVNERKIYSDYMAKLRKSSKVEVFMQRPRVKVSLDDDPHRGNPKGPIKIVEFSEFQCPFCKRARPTIDQVLKNYKGKIHYVFRDFPLSFHKQAPKAAQAAHCAGEQKKYWEYSDKLWDNQRALQLDKLRGYAADLKLNVDKFNKCLDSNKYAEEIAKDFKEGASYGVTGTPAYFINGVFISGAQPYEKFAEIIDEELAALN